MIRGVYLGEKARKLRDGDFRILKRTTTAETTAERGVGDGELAMERRGLLIKKNPNGCGLSESRTWRREQPAREQISQLL